MKEPGRLKRAMAACCVPLLAAGAACANPDAAGRAPLRDPMQPPADSRPAASSAAAPVPSAAPAPARHLMVVDGRRYVVSGGRKRGVGEMLGDARIERIEDSAVVVRQDGALLRLPLYGDVQRRPAAESPAVPAPPPAASAMPRPARPVDAGALSLARPERPKRPDFGPDFGTGLRSGLRPELRPDFPPALRPESPYRAGDPQ